MKTCPKCWKNYPDRYKQCVRCKKTLVNSNKTRSNLSQKKENFDLNKIKQIKTEKREDKFLEEVRSRFLHNFGIALVYIGIIVIAIIMTIVIMVLIVKS